MRNGDIVLIIFACAAQLAAVFTAPSRWHVAVSAMAFALGILLYRPDRSRP